MNARESRSPKLLSDTELIQRVFDHIDAKTTDLGDTVWREPVDHYRSQERFDREMSLFTRIPTVFCPVAALPEPGSYVARSIAGMPLLAVRGDDGVIRTFHNACRHRGMMLAEGQGKVRGGFVCRYHAWAYGLNGALKGTAGGAEGFPGLDRAEHGLKEVATVQESGLVFVTLNAPVAEGALAWLPPIIQPDQVVFDYSTWVDEGNWKLLKEFSMEGYHIKSLHHESFYPYGYDNLNVVETFGPNSRVTFPFRRMEKLRDKPKHEWSLDGKGTYVMQIFPSTRLSALSKHDQLVILEPLTVSSTRWHIYRLTKPGWGGSEEALAEAKRDATFVKDTGLEEDRAAALSSQQSLGGEGNTHFTFGRFEKAVVHFHRELDALLEKCP